MKKRVAILISGGGSNMETLVQSMTADHPARPVLVLSNRPDAGGLEKAKSHGVRTAVVDHTRFGTDRAAFETDIDDHLHNAGAEIICLAGFMRILSADFVAKWAGRILNIHPSLLPEFKGLNTHSRAIEAGKDLHGCTVHEVTAELDDGRILGQSQLKIDVGDTPEQLAARVLKLEHRLYPAVLHRFASGNKEPIFMK